MSKRILGLKIKTCFNYDLKDIPIINEEKPQTKNNFEESKQVSEINFSVDKISKNLNTQQLLVINKKYSIEVLKIKKQKKAYEIQKNNSLNILPLRQKILSIEIKKDRKVENKIENKKVENTIENNSFEIINSKNKIILEITKNSCNLEILQTPNNNTQTKRKFENGKNETNEKQKKNIIRYEITNLVNNIELLGKLKTIKNDYIICSKNSMFEIISQTKVEKYKNSKFAVLKKTSINNLEISSQVSIINYINSKRFQKTQKISDIITKVKKFDILSKKKPEKPFSEIHTMEIQISSTKKNKTNIFDIANNETQIKIIPKKYKRKIEIDKNKINLEIKGSFIRKRNKNEQTGFENIPYEIKNQVITHEIICIPKNPTLATQKIEINKNTKNFSEIPEMKFKSKNQKYDSLKTKSPNKIKINHAIPFIPVTNNFINNTDTNDIKNENNSESFKVNSDIIQLEKQYENIKKDLNDLYPVISKNKQYRENFFMNLAAKNQAKYNFYLSLYKILKDEHEEKNNNTFGDYNKLKKIIDRKKNSKNKLRPIKKNYSSSHIVARNKNSFTEGNL